MTNMNISQRLHEIQKAATEGDDEKAHCLRDKLYEDALLAIAQGIALSPAGLAAAVLDVKKIEFSVWCA